MRPFISLAAAGCPLPYANIDTDQLIPARFMRRPRAEGYGPFLLHDLRRRAEDELDPAFTLDHSSLRRHRDPGRTPQFRLRLVARGGGLCAR